MILIVLQRITAEFNSALIEKIVSCLIVSYFDLPPEVILAICCIVEALIKHASGSRSRNLAEFFHELTRECKSQWLWSAVKILVVLGLELNSHNAEAIVFSLKILAECLPIRPKPRLMPTKKS